ncbi:hypothetical protein TRVA0_052S00408 [Trichomonascus vanleenenianus]|uniref:telomere repeat binding factor family protein n=1 Tax=Trichomonascus vanleenenianus TaxID=2268995 RepID=UPI003ECB701D
MSSTSDAGDTDTTHKRGVDAEDDEEPHQGAKRAKTDGEDDDVIDLDDSEQLRFIAQQLQETASPEPSSPDDNSSTPTEPGVTSSSVAARREPSVVSMATGPVGTTSEELQRILETDPLRGLDESKILTETRELLQKQSLPLLDNLSTQILNILVKGSYTHTIQIATDPEMEDGRIYRQLLSLFEQAKQIYTEEAFLSVRQLENICTTKEQRAVIQRANLTTFMNAILGITPVGFFYLNEFFLDSFVSEQGKLLKSQGTIFLDLKTQAYISALNQDHDRPKNEIIEELFPTDMQKVLFQRRPDSNKGQNALTLSESDFISRCKNRRKKLEEEDNPEVLAETYSWLGFLKDVIDYVSRNRTQIVSDRSTVVMALPTVPTTYVPKPNNDIFAKARGTYHVWNSNTSTKTSTKAASTATSTTASAVSQGSPAATGGALSSQPSPALASKNTHGISSVTSSSNDYTSSKPMPGTPGNKFQRNPWTKEEEEALMSGLDKVQGPYWSKILELYGAGGTISEVLKERTQVQLKDKARNLKMYFTKVGSELPRVLTYVTGDASKRGRRKIAPTTPVPAGSSIPPSMALPAGSAPLGSGSPATPASSSPPPRSVQTPTPSTSQPAKPTCAPNSSEPAAKTSSTTISATTTTNGNTNSSNNDNDNREVARTTTPSSPASASAATSTTTSANANAEKPLATTPSIASADQKQSEPEIDPSLFKSSIRSEDASSEQGDDSANLEQLIRSVAGYIDANGALKTKE